MNTALTIFTTLSILGLLGGAGFAAYEFLPEGSISAVLPTATDSPAASTEPATEDLPILESRWGTHTIEDRNSDWSHTQNMPYGAMGLIDVHSDYGVDYDYTYRGTAVACFAATHSEAQAWLEGGPCSNEFSGQPTKDGFIYAYSSVSIALKCYSTQCSYALQIQA